MHSNQQSAAIAIATIPFFNMRRQMPPTSQIEVAYTEVGAFRDLHGLLKRRQELLFDVVKYSWHSFSVWPL
jgi:hypothetical protein